MIKRHCSQLRENQSGSFAIFFAIILPVLLSIIGLSVDFYRGYMLREELQRTLDASALAATYTMTLGGDPEATATAYFRNNWQAGFLGSGLPVLISDFDAELGTVTLTASASISTILLQSFIDNDTIAVAARSVARRQVRSLEVALAIDNTTSMRYGVNAESSTVPPEARSRLRYVKGATKILLDALYGEEDKIDNMWVSVIPFTSLVNVGANNTDFLRAGSMTGLVWAPQIQSEFPNEWVRSIEYNQSWRGCVFERGAGQTSGTYTASQNDVTDQPPSAEAFYPYNLRYPNYIMHVQCKVNYTGSGTSEVCPVVDGIKQPCYNVGTNGTNPVAVANPTGCRQVSTLKDYSSYCSTHTSDLAQNCIVPGAGNIHNGGNYCTANRGPARACFSWEAKRGDNGSGWELLTGSNRDFPVPSNIKNAFPVPGMVSLGVGNNAYPTNLRFTRLHSGFPVEVRGDDVSSCGNAANVWYSYCSGQDGLSTGRWIAPWPHNTPSSPVLGGYGNSGCGLPVLPLVSSRDVVENRIEQMSVPDDLPLEKSGGSTFMPPAVGYSGTIINQGLVWAWRSLSPLWQGYWDGIENASLPRQYSSEDVTNNKVIVLLTDGLTYMPRRMDWDATSNYSYQRSVVAPYVKNSYFNGTWPLPLPDHTTFDSSAYGRLADNWLRTNWTGATLNAYGTEANTGSGPPYYRELMRRFDLTCSNIRAEGVRIYMVLFALDSHPMKADAISHFKSCVGEDGRFYDAVNDRQLREAFKDISASLVHLRLLE